MSVRVLLTNDDGVDAEGLNLLRASLMEIASSVQTVAPAANCSGLSRSCSYATPVRVRQINGGRNPVYVCEGSPTDCVRIGLATHLLSPADIVVSGVNEGANLGDDVVYSGTVAAGLEAARLGRPAVCLSQQSPTCSLAFNEVITQGSAVTYDYGLAARIGALIVRAVHERHPGPVVLNVNFPGSTEAHGIEAASLARRSYAGHRAIAENSDGDAKVFYPYGGPNDQDWCAFRAEDGSDVAAIVSGRISVTPLDTGQPLGATCHARDLAQEIAKLLGGHNLSAAQRGRLEPHGNDRDRQSERTEHDQR